MYSVYFFEIDYYNDFLRSSIFFWEKDTSTSNYSGGGFSQEYEFKYTQIYRILTFFIAFPLLFFSLSALIQLKNKNNTIYNYSRVYILSSLIIIIGYSSSLSYIGAGSPRYAFLLFPVMIPLIILGLNNFILGQLQKLNIDISNRFKILWFIIIIQGIFSVIISIYDKEVRLNLGLWI